MAGEHGADTTREGLERVAVRLSARYTSVGEMACDLLRAAIDTSVFQPNQWQRQEWLAEILAVSRIPVRSTLIQLEPEGLIVFYPRREVKVRTLTIDEVKEAYDMRALRELYMPRKSMATRTSERLERLAQLADRLDQVSEGTEFLESEGRIL